MHSETVLSNTTLSEYLRTWRPKLSHSNTKTTAIHLNNRETKHELVVHNNNLLPFCTVPTYLGVKLDRSLTFRDFIEAIFFCFIIEVYAS